MNRRDMNTTNRKHKRVATAVGLALVLAAVIPSGAEASQLRFYDLPLVSAQADGDTHVWEIDALISGQLEDLLPRTAQANNGSAFADGEASTNAFWATATSGSPGAAITRAFVPFVIRDPQARGAVKVNVSSKFSSTQGNGFKGAVSVGPPPSRLSQSDATVAVRVVPGGGPYMISYTNDGWFEYLEWPVPGLPDYDAFSASAQAQCYNDGPDTAPEVKCQWQKRVAVNNYQIDGADGSGGSVTLDVSPTLHLRTGVSYVIMIEASTNFNATAVIDPLLEPHPDNPDIIIEFPNAVPDPNPRPMMSGITAEELLARGIDPQPFIDVGFLASAPPPQPPPPPPPSPPSPPPQGDKSWCWPGFWLKNATIYGASAWPAAVPTYYDYNQTAGQLSGCPAASGNPTLLQVLQNMVSQNPSPYFGTGLNDAGLNCVADYLSRQSGLQGTKADNNGTCSIGPSGGLTK